jgi:O-antigen ligase
LCFILFHLNKKLLQKILVSLVFITIILINLPSVQDFFNAFVRLETVSERSISWEIGWDIMMDNFLFGIGPENYESKVFTYVPSSAWQYFEVDTSIFKVHPHNYFLLMTTENGILGLILSLLIFYVLFRLSWQIMKITKNNQPEEYLISLSIYSIGIVLFIRAFFEVDGIFSYGFITRDLPFWICFVVLAHLKVMQNHDIQIINRSENLE